MRKTLRQDRVASWSGLIFLGGVAAVLGLYFICANLASREGATPVLTFIWQFLDIAREGSAPEMIGHGLAFLTASLLLLTALETGARSAVFLTALFGFVWLDDALSFHESLGHKLDEAFALSERFDLAINVGELLTWGGAGACLLLVLLWALRRRRAGELGLLLLFVPPFAVLVVCGIAVDAISSFTLAVPGSVAVLIEDGGEMLAVAWAAYLSVGVMRGAKGYFKAFGPAPQAN